MAITGNLAEFSLPAIFQFLEHQQGTGLLLIHAPSDSPTQEKQRNYIWLHRGSIVAVADSLDNKGLTSLISQRGWLKFEEIPRMISRCPYSRYTPIGICLRDQGALSSEQLKLLFYVSVLLRVCALFKLKDGQFVFDTTAALPRAEMTGMSLSAAEAILWGLRVLRDWTSLATKLPAPESVLTKAMSRQPHVRLDSLERQIWQLVNGKASVKAIAEHLHLSIETVQQITCRLSMVGLLEEVAIITSSQQREHDVVDVEYGTANLAKKVYKGEKTSVQNCSQSFGHSQTSPYQPSGVRNTQQSNSLGIGHFSPPVVVGSF